MRKSVGSLNGSKVLVAILVMGAAASVACSKGEDQQTSAWNCERADVPMGEITRCTEGSGNESTASNGTAVTGSAQGGGGDLGIRTYGLPSEDAGSTAPAPAPSGSSSGGESTDTGAASSGDTPYECTPGSSPDCPAPSAPAPQGDSSSTPGPDECSYVPDLPYCQAGGGTAGGATAGSDAAGGTTAPGPWNCTKDMNGNKVCESPPTCAMGTHPSKCGTCVADGEADTCASVADSGCWVTGGGFIVEPSIVPVQAADDGHDNYGGNAKQMKDGRVQGHWNHVDHGTKNHAKGKPEYIFCRHVDEPGPGQPGGKKGFDMNQIYFGGHAEWREADTGAWASGYWFDVVAKDHGEPGCKPSPKNGGMVDTYHFTIRKMDDPQAKVSGAIVYEVKGGLVGGNIQIHPPNPGHPGFQSPLPAWVSLEP